MPKPILIFAQNKFLASLVFALLMLFAWSVVNPYDMRVWCVEMTSVFLVFFALVFTYPKFQFSNTSYFIVSLWLALHTIGAHYTFERVPFEFVSEFFGFQRNHFDRFAHFIIGLNSYGVAEFMLKTGRVRTSSVAAFVGILFIMALANAWELIEWIYAELEGGEVGAAFLGSQGDVWDAQKDMLADTLGAVFASFVFFLKKNRKIKT